MSRANRTEKTRIPITLSCTTCGARNYKTSRSKKTEGKMTLKKFCPTCTVHTVHIDSK